MSVICTEGGHTSDWPETAQTILDGWFGIEKEGERPQAMREDRSYEEWTEQEVKTTVKKMKNNKSSGGDKVEAEMIKEMIKDSQTLQELTMLYSACQKCAVLRHDWKEGIVDSPAEIKGKRPPKN